jgi:hypothetical protein
VPPSVDPRCAGYTNFTTLFGGTDSLKNFWHNLSTMSPSRSSRQLAEGAREKRALKHSTRELTAGIILPQHS